MASSSLAPALRGTLAPTFSGAAAWFNAPFLSLERCSLMRCAAATSSTPLIQKRFLPKHFLPKWKRERKEKYLKIELPDFQKYLNQTKMDPAQLREIRKKEGKAPPRTWSKPFSIGCTESVFEPYIPPEGDGRRSSIGTGAKKVITELEKKGKSYLQLRKVRQYEEDFDPKIFVQKAHDILVEAQNLLPKFKDNEDRLHDLVTEKAYPIMIHGLEKKTLTWKFLESIEAPRVMHIRTTSLLSDDNVYGQVTVRFYTKQMLAVYDRFGRLLYGSEKHPKDVLEYIVFEKHLADELGKWRIHEKIIPEWLPPLDPVVSTLVQPDFGPEGGAGGGSSSAATTPAAVNQAFDSSPQPQAAQAAAP